MKVFLVLILMSKFVYSSVESSESFVGTYDLDVRISGDLFEDIFRIEKINETPAFKVLGEFEVPGVFRAPFNGELKGEEIRGRFVAVENGRELEVLLQGDFGNICAVTGILLQDGKAFGEFKGRKRGCHDTSY